MNKIYIISNILFIIYWITRINPIVKFLSTFLLSIYNFRIGEYTNTLKLINYSIGDYLIEIYPENVCISLIFFINGKTFELRQNIYKFIYLIFIIYFILFDIYNIIVLLLYMSLHIVSLHNCIKQKQKHKLLILSNVLYIISDSLIGINMYIIDIKNYEYVSYLLYWISNLIY